MESDLESHFAMLQAQQIIVTPSILKNNYKTPLTAQQIKNERMENFSFGEDLDQLIEEFLSFNKKKANALKYGTIPCKEKLASLTLHENKIRNNLEAITRRANIIMDNKKHRKTLMLAINEYLLNFLQLCISGHRSGNSLEKMIGRKRRYASFILYRYHATDMLLADLEFSFIKDLYKYLLTHFGVIGNTASKYAQCLKEIIDRAVANQWMSTNIFTPGKHQFKVHYTMKQKSL